MRGYSTLTVHLKPDSFKKFSRSVVDNNWGISLITENHPPIEGHNHCELIRCELWAYRMFYETPILLALRQPCRFGPNGERYASALIQVTPNDIDLSGVDEETFVSSFHPVYEITDTISRDELSEIYHGDFSRWKKRAIGMIDRVKSEFSERYLIPWFDDEDKRIRCLKNTQKSDIRIFLSGQGKVEGRDYRIRSFYSECDVVDFKMDKEYFNSDDARKYNVERYWMDNIYKDLHETPKKYNRTCISL